MTERPSLQTLERERDRLKHLHALWEQETQTAVYRVQLETEIANYRRWIQNAGGNPRRQGAIMSSDPVRPHPEAIGQPPCPHCGGLHYGQRFDNCPYVKLADDSTATEEQRANAREILRLGAILHGD